MEIAAVDYRKVVGMCSLEMALELQLLMTFLKKNYAMFSGFDGNGGVLREASSV